MIPRLVCLISVMLGSVRTATLVNPQNCNPPGHWLPGQTLDVEQSKKLGANVDEIMNLWIPKLQDCMDKCCRMSAENCSVASLEMQNSGTTCVLYSCHPREHCIFKKTARYLTYDRTMFVPFSLTKPSTSTKESTTSTSTPTASTLPTIRDVPLPSSTPTNSTKLVSTETTTTISSTTKLKPFNVTHTTNNKNPVLTAHVSNSILNSKPVHRGREGSVSSHVQSISLFTSSTSSPTHGPSTTTTTALPAKGRQLVKAGNHQAVSVVSAVKPRKGVSPPTVHNVDLTSSPFLETSMTFFGHTETHRKRPSLTSGSSVILDPLHSDNQSGKGSPHLGIILGLSCGLLVVFSVALLIAKRALDTWHRRHYARVDFLIDGMYNNGSGY